MAWFNWEALEDMADERITGVLEPEICPSLDWLRLGLVLIEDRLPEAEIEGPVLWKDSRCDTDGRLRCKSDLEADNPEGSVIRLAETAPLGCLCGKEVLRPEVSGCSMRPMRGLVIAGLRFPLGAMVDLLIDSRSFLVVRVRFSRFMPTEAPGLMEDLPSPVSLEAFPKREVAWDERTTC